MPFHFCQDELYMLLMAIPFLGAAVGWIQARLHHHKHHSDCTK